MLELLTQIMAAFNDHAGDVWTLLVQEYALRNYVLAAICFSIFAVWVTACATITSRALKRARAADERDLCHESDVIFAGIASIVPVIIPVFFGIAALLSAISPNLSLLLDLIK